SECFSLTCLLSVNNETPTAPPPFFPKPALYLKRIFSTDGSHKVSNPYFSLNPDNGLKAFSPHIFEVLKWVKQCCLADIAFGPTAILHAALPCYNFRPGGVYVHSNAFQVYVTLHRPPIRYFLLKV